jgi:CRISPR-associated protein Csx10
MMKVGNFYSQIMQKIKLKITALSPLAIAARKPGSVSEAQDHIPGSVIRGAIANQILQVAQQQTSDIFSKNLIPDGGDFAELFLSDSSAIFQNAYPAVAKISTQDESGEDIDIYQVVKNPIQIMVLPATAVSSKEKPGFKPKGNGVFDTLIDRFLSNVYDFPYDPSDPGTFTRVEPFNGFYSKDGKGQYYPHSNKTRFLTRVGINRQRSTSEDDILYSIAVLNESFPDKSPKNSPDWQNFVYHSTILVANPELADNLVDFINRNPRLFRLGSATSRGLGKVEITASIQNNAPEVERKIQEFNRKISDRWKPWSVFGQSDEDLLKKRTYFTLDLQSDAILTENWLRTTVISEKMLCDFVGLAEIDNSLKLELAYSSYDHRSGWNSAWGLMKDIELVTNRGGVYLFSVNKEDEKKWIDKLTDLELNGVGDRTAEGFGQIQICNEFHHVLREEAK